MKWRRAYLLTLLLCVLVGAGCSKDDWSSGDRVLVAGTAPVPPGGGPPPAEPYAQARLCLDLIGAALAEAGTSLEHVIRTRMYLTGAEHWEEVARAHGEVFAAVRPAATAVIVAGLLDPAWLVEIEAEALLPETLLPGTGGRS